jgi:hypothetical protein
MLRWATCTASSWVHHGHQNRWKQPAKACIELHYFNIPSEGWMTRDPLHAHYLNVSAISSASTITILKPSKYSALTCSPLPPSGRQPTTVNYLWEAPNSMTKPATTAKFNTTSIVSSAPSFLAFLQTPGLPPTQKQCSKIYSYTISMQLCTTSMLLHQCTRLPPRRLQGHGINPHKHPCRN